MRKKLIMTLCKQVLKEYFVIKSLKEPTQKELEEYFVKCAKDSMKETYGIYLIDKLNFSLSENEDTFTLTSSKFIQFKLFGKTITIV